MTEGVRAPGPLLLLGIGLCIIAFTTTHPLIIGAVLVVAVLLTLAAPSRSTLVLTIAAIAAIGVVVLNPFVQVNGDLILFELPGIPILDTQVTLEEVVAGLVLGARAAAVTLVVMSTLALADPDRLLALASRLAPNSALAASIAARLVPTLRRDAAGLTETARLRGRALTTGRWRSRVRTTGALAVPLLGSSLDRAIDVAEAMAARGYGAGPRTRPPRPPLTSPDRVIAVAAIVLIAVGGLTIASRIGDFDFYPRLTPLGETGSIAAMVVVLGAGSTAAIAAARR